MGQNILLLTTQEASEKKFLTPKELIKGIVKEDETDYKDSPNNTSSQFVQVWKIVNKYYETEVTFNCMDSETFASSSTNKNYEAVIFVFNSSIDSADINNSKQLISMLDKCNPSIRLAVCEKCGSVDDGASSQFLSRKDLIEWGLDHDFELVEICPDEEDYTEYEDYGVTRLRGALEAHVWPNINATSSPTPDSSNKSGASSTNGITSPIDKGDIMNESSPDQLLKDCEDFDELFQKLNDFKLNCDANKSSSSRIDYAERVVAAFLNALGDEGDSDSSN